MEWLKRLTSGTDDDQASLTSSFGGILMVDLAPLAKKAPSLLKDVTRYILKGEPADVLLKLRSGHYGEILKLGCCERDYSKKAQRAIFKNMDFDKVSCYVRLLQVYEAAASTSQNLHWVIPAAGVSRWLDIFIQEATGLRQYVWDSKILNTNITVDFIEKMLEIAGESRDMLVRAALFLNPTDYSTQLTLTTITSLQGFQSRLAHHASVVLEALNHSEHRIRIQALGVLFHNEVELMPFIEKIASLACCPAKTVREAAQKIILQKPELFREIIQEILNEGDNQERIQAARLFVQIHPEKAKDVLEAKLGTEKASKVKATIEAVLTEPRSSSCIKAETLQIVKELDFEPVPNFDSFQPLPKEIAQNLAYIIQTYNEQAKSFNKAHENEQHYRHYKMELASEGQIPEAFEQLQNLVVRKKTQRLWNINSYNFNQFYKLLETIVAKPEFNLVHLFRLAIIFGELHWVEKGEFRFGVNGEKLIPYYFQSHSIPFDTRLVAVAARTVGLDDETIGWNFLESSYFRNQILHKPQDYWMYFFEHLDILEESLGFRPKTHRSHYIYWDKEIRQAAFHILTAFPQPPENFMPKLWELAFDGPKLDRPLARQCLSTVPGREKRIIEALKDGRQQVRAEASNWLAEINLTAAIPDLKEALKKEKSDVAKGAMMEALEMLGVSVDDFLDRASLKQEAEKVLAKGVPAQIQWFPFEVLPSVRWDNGKQVDPIIIQWMIILGYKLGSPEPVPAIRKYCQFMNQNERRDLGRYILQAWLTQDTIPRYTIENATPEARSRAKQYKQWYPDKSEEQLFQDMLHSLLTECLGSAIKEKGVLAVSAACCGPEIVPIVEAYLKKWYGHRVHQCKALIQMLSWNEHPLAIQLLLSVANRFRTKGIQEQATQCVNELAERQGWTLDELADRTIPTAGFNETSQLELNYGSRKFICKLNDELAIELFNQEDKPIKNLPDVGKGDDSELVKAAKKEFSEAKRILKQVLRLQRERLYENMCTQRRWQFIDLQQFLFEHPLMSRYCRRLVWAQINNGKTGQTFRLMEDRSLTDAEDNLIKLPDDAIIQLAHSCNISPEQSKAWQQHFADYKVEPLFDQLTNPMYKLTEEDRKNDGISQYLGYMMDNFKLRGLAVKFGYTRGQAEDGGFFYHYKKRFSGLKIEAVIEFTGVPLPEENVKVALKNLYFTQIEEGDSGYFGSENLISLEDIPPVLLSETWNDLRRIAEAGDGCDAQWEKKVAY